MKFIVLNSQILVYGAIGIILWLIIAFTANFPGEFKVGKLSMAHRGIKVCSIGVTLPVYLGLRYSAGFSDKSRQIENTITGI